MGNLYEGFYENPCEQKKLLSILPDNVVMISGDRHVGGFYQLDAMGGGEYGAMFRDNNGNPVASLNKKDYATLPLLEVTASSLTHAWNTAGLEEGNNRVPGYDIVRTDHFGQLDIDWVARTFRASLVPSNTANAGAMPSEVGSTVTIELAFPAVKAERILCPAGCNQAAGRRLLFSSVPTPSCPTDCYEPQATCPAPFPTTCVAPAGAAVQAAAAVVLQEFGTHPTDPLLYVNPNVTLTPLMSSGEYGTLAYDSMWQVPASWNGLSMVTGATDGAGIKVLSKGLVRYYTNNEVPAGNGVPFRYSASATKGSPGYAYPTMDESFVMNGATVRYYDMEVEFKAGGTKYTHVVSGVAIKRVYISTDSAPTGELVTSVNHMKALTGIEGMSRFCGGDFHIKAQYSHLLAGAGFEDEMYIAGHEDSTYGGIGVLDTMTGSTYLLPTSMMVETATPIYSGMAGYVALVVNLYPEPTVGQRIHLYIGKKQGSDFLGRNGLNPKYGQMYVLTVSGHETWANMDALADYAGAFVPVETAVNALNSGGSKNEWSSVNLLMPNMWAQAMTGLGDISVSSIASLTTATMMTKNGVQLPAAVDATTKRLRIQDVDPIFGNPDGLVRAHTAIYIHTHIYIYIYIYIELYIYIYIYIYTYIYIYIYIYNTPITPLPQRPPPPLGPEPAC